MGVRFILGRSGCGKTEYMLNEIKQKAISEDEKSPIIILLPEQYTYEMEKRVSNMFASGAKDRYMRVRPMGLKTLSDLVFSYCGNLSKVGINAAGKAIITHNSIEAVSNELDLFSKSYTQPGFTTTISDMISELKQFMITPDRLDEIIGESGGILPENLVMKLKDIAKIYREFEKKLHEDYVDMHDRVVMLTEKISECSFLDDMDLYVDGYTSFTPNQYELLKELMKKAKSTTFLFTMDSPFKTGYADYFASTRNTYNRIKDICEKEGIKVEKDVNLCNEDIKRFRGNEELQHLERYYNSYPYRIYQKKTEKIRIREYSNLYNEVEEVAKEIANDIIDGRYRYKDITIAARSIDSYESLIKSIFSEYKIPFYINKKSEAKNNPIITMIVSVLEMKKRRYGYETMFRYLKSGLLDFTEDEISLLENYVIANGISGNKWFEDVWEYRLPNSFYEYEESEEELETKKRINDIKNRVIEPIKKFDEKLSSKKRNTVEDICKYLYEFLEDINIFEKIEETIEKLREKGMLESAARYSQVWNMVSDLLDQLVEIMGDEKISLERFIRIVNIALDEYELKTIPPSIDQVTVTEVDRMNNPNTKHLYLIGTVDGVFPMPSKENGLLSDSDRGKLSDIDVELDKDSRKRVFEEQFLVYKAITATSDRLTVSYPIADSEGKTQRASIIISRIKKLFKNVDIKSYFLEGVYEKEDLKEVNSKIPTFNTMVDKIKEAADKDFEKGISDIWKDTYEYYLNDDRYNDITKRIVEGIDFTNQFEYVDEEKIKELYNSKTISVSRLEKYASCPFAYFIEYGMKAKDRKEYLFTAPDVGSFVHKVIENYSKTMHKDGITWHEVDDKYIELRVSEMVDELIAKIPGFILESSPKYKYLAHRLKVLITVSIKIIADQIKQGRFEPDDYEVEFGKKRKYPSIEVEYKENEKIELIGKIDRIDKYINEENKEFVRIVDYKWGKNDINLNDVYYGLQLQLLVYMDAILEGGEIPDNVPIKPAAMLYSRMDNPIISRSTLVDDEEVKQRIIESFKMNGMLIKDIDILSYMDKALELPGGKSKIIKAARNKKDGSVSKSTSGVTDEQFETIRAYIKKSIKDLCTDMMSGNIKIEPKKSKDKDSCRFCSYSSICQFDTALKNNCYKVIPNRTSDDVIKMMEGDVK